MWNQAKIIVYLKKIANKMYCFVVSFKFVTKKNMNLFVSEGETK